MVLEVLKKLFTRDLNRLITELQQYGKEEDIWLVKGQIKNSAGNLCLHLVGNLNTYIGRHLGETTYVRDRDREFSTTFVPRDELIAKVKDTITMVNHTLDNFPETLLETEYPILVLEQKTSIEFLLIHLATHLTYHLGQINYHRRLTEKTY